MSCSAARPTSTALDRLESGMRYRLVLIVTPAGAGKTRLLRKWVWERSKSNLSATAWVTLEQLDNDIEIFLEHLIAAIARITPQLESRLVLLRRDQEALNSEGVLIDVINLLAKIPQEIAVILDEYHLIQSPEVHQAISFLIDYLPGNVHVYLATRYASHFRFAHLRARREMIEIGPGELSSIFE